LLIVRLSYQLDKVRPWCLSTKPYQQNLINRDRLSTRPYQQRPLIPGQQGHRLLLPLKATPLRYAQWRVRMVHYKEIFLNLKTASRTVMRKACDTHRKTVILGILLSSPLPRSSCYDFVIACADRATLDTFRGRLLGVFDGAYEGAHSHLPRMCNRA
jgi:hypothetical protein